MTLDGEPQNYILSGLRNYYGDKSTRALHGVPGAPTWSHGPSTTQHHGIQPKIGHKNTKHPECQLFTKLLVTRGS